MMIPSINPFVFHYECNDYLFLLQDKVFVQHKPINNELVNIYLTSMMEYFCSGVVAKTYLLSTDL